MPNRPHYIKSLFLDEAVRADLAGMPHLAEMLVAIANGDPLPPSPYGPEPEWEPITEAELDEAERWLHGPEGRRLLSDEPTALESVDGALPSPMLPCPSA